MCASLKLFTDAPVGYPEPVPGQPLNLHSHPTEMLLTKVSSKVRDQADLISGAVLKFSRRMSQIISMDKLKDIVTKTLEFGKQLALTGKKTSGKTAAVLGASGIQGELLWNFFG